MGEWIKEMWYIHATEYYSALKKKKGNHVIRKNMGEPEGHYTK